jgi:hypothetical protein
MFLLNGDVIPNPPRDVGPYSKDLGKCLFRPRAEHLNCFMMDAMGRKSSWEKNVFTKRGTLWQAQWQMRGPPILHGLVERNS